MEIALAALDETPVAIPDSFPRRLLRPVGERDVDPEAQIHVSRDGREPLGAGRRLRPDLAPGVCPAIRLHDDPVAAGERFPIATITLQLHSVSTDPESRSLEHP